MREITLDKVSQGDNDLIVIKTNTLVKDQRFVTAFGQLN